MGYRGASGAGDGGRARASGLPKTWTVSSFGSWAHEREPDSPPPQLTEPSVSRVQNLVTITLVVLWMGSNLAVLLLNKLLLTFWSFRQPVLLTFLHMATATMFTWGLWSIKALSIQRIRSTPQLLKLMSMSLVFALAVLSANVSLKFLAVSMNQAIGAATPVFAAFFAFVCQGQVEHTATYATLLFVVGGVIVASGVEPNLHLFGAFICFVAAGMRGLRAVLQAILLRPEEKLDSMSCLAYMVPSSSVLMLLLCAILEPGAYGVLMRLPSAGLPMLVAISANCAAAFASNYLNMAVTKRTSALSIQVLGQCKGVISAIVSVLCFRNIVPVWGWIGYGVTVVGCLAYGRCKARFKVAAPAKKEASAVNGASNDRTHDTQQWLAQVRERHGPFPMSTNNIGESEQLMPRAFSDAAVLEEQSRERMHPGQMQNHDAQRFGTEQGADAMLMEPESLAALSDGSDLSAGEDEVRERSARARHPGHERERMLAEHLPPRAARPHVPKVAEVSRAKHVPPLNIAKHGLPSAPAPASMRSLIGVPTPGQRTRESSRASIGMESLSALPDGPSSLSSDTLRMSVLRLEPAADARLVHA